MSIYKKKFYPQEGNKTVCRVTCDTRTKAIELASKRDKRKPLQQASVDLSDVDVQATAYVGFTSAAASASLVSRHFVVGWSLAMDGPAAPTLNIAAPKPHVRKC
jgi:hypothetical protein